MDLNNVSAADLVQAIFKAVKQTPANGAPAPAAPVAAPAPAALVVVDPVKQNLLLEKASRFVAIDKTLRQLKKEKAELGVTLYTLIPEVAADKATVTLSDGSTVTIGQKTEKRPTKGGIMEFFTAKNLKEQAEEYWGTLKGKLKKCLMVSHPGDVEPENDED